MTTLEQQRAALTRQQLELQGQQLATHEAMWLELARALGGAGLLSLEQLAQQLEAQAQREPQALGRFFGLVHLAQQLRGEPAPACPWGARPRRQMAV